MMDTIPYRQFSVVLTGFPFTDKTSQKKRPAVVLSNDRYHQVFGDYLLMMVTSRSVEEGLDLEMADWQQAGLTFTSYFRPILFTLREHRLLGLVGMLNDTDQMLAMQCLNGALSV